VHVAEREPLEAGLPDDAEPVLESTDVPTMVPVPIPDDFDPDEPSNFIDLDETP
jgi:hypothetical protein